MKFTTSPPAEVLKVFETVPNMYLILSPDLYILTASDLYLEATQTTREKLIGQHIFEAFPDNPAIPHADGVKNIHASLQRVLATRKPDQMPVQHYDVPHPTQPGVFLERYWLPSHTPVLDEQGEVSYIIQLATNITDTIRANHQLKASQDREIAALAEIERQRAQLQAIIEQAPVALAFLKGADHRIESANPLICQLWGRPQADLLGRPLWEVLSEVRAPGFEQAMARVWRTGIAFQGRELPVQLKRRGVSETIYVNFVYQPLHNDQGVITGILNAVIDVSEQVLARQKVEQSEQVLQALNHELAATVEELRAANEEIQAVNEELLQTQQELQQLNQQLEERVARRTAQLRQAFEELQAANQRLERSNVDLDTFVYTASHDLKSPVISLDALLSRLATRLASKLDSREQEMLALIQSSSSRLQQTIRDLTQIAQVQRDIQEEKTLVGFEELLSEIQADLSSQLEASGANLRVDFQVPSLAYTRKNLRSILYNLVSNAVKYRSPERVLEIVIDTYQQEGRTVLRVSDNGLGLTEQQRQGMFVMFKRFHTHVEGSGVGLYTIKRIIENYGGQIIVDSQLGQGATFQVQF